MNIVIIGPNERVFFSNNIKMNMLNLSFEVNFISYFLKNIFCILDKELFILSKNNV